MCVRSLSVMSDSATPRTVALQAPLSMGYSRQEYWSGQPCPPPGDVPDPGTEPGFLCALHRQVGSLPLSHLLLLGQFLQIETSSMYLTCQCYTVSGAGDDRTWSGGGQLSPSIVSPTPNPSVFTSAQHSLTPAESSKCHCPSPPASNKTHVLTEQTS